MSVFITLITVMTLFMRQRWVAELRELLVTLAPVPPRAWDISKV